jgi:hypothetical protein
MIITVHHHVLCALSGAPIHDGELVYTLPYLGTRSKPKVLAPFILTKIEQGYVQPCDLTWGSWEWFQSGIILKNQTSDQVFYNLRLKKCPDKSIDLNIENLDYPVQALHIKMPVMRTLLEAKASIHSNLMTVFNMAQFYKQEERYAQVKTDSPYHRELSNIFHPVSREEIEKKMPNKVFTGDLVNTIKVFKVMNFLGMMFSNDEPPFNDSDLTLKGEILKAGWG